MENLQIPLFIKDMGYRFLSHILNIDEKKANDLINDKYELDQERTRCLKGLISICMQSRFTSIDKNAQAIEYSMFKYFQNMIVNDRHAFNIWREDLGGKISYLTVLILLSGQQQNLLLKYTPYF